MAEEKKAGLNLVQKIAKVQAGIGEIKKEGYNKIQNYDFVTEAQIKKLVRQPLAKLGVIINPKFKTTNEWNETTKKGGIMHYTSVLGTFEITDGETTIVGTMPGTGMDSGDKAGYKAETGSQKNYLMQLFMISTGDDPEQDRVQQPNNGRYSNYPSNNDNYSNQRGNYNRQVVNKAMINQIVNSINANAETLRVDPQEVYDTVKGRYKFNTLNDISNDVANEILIYLNPKGAKDNKNAKR